jgi:hypothetical protein
MHGPPRVRQARATVAGGAEQVAHLPLEPDRSSVDLTLRTRFDPMRSLEIRAPSL